MLLEEAEVLDEELLDEEVLDEEVLLEEAELLLEEEPESEPLLEPSFFVEL